ncbi:hypothetical protein BSKO_04943 [Bryopsis sp. KO-2023]|nr:hypothetical protein BSKO_04943 [Bryopsis sp. KO-2023]
MPIREIERVEWAAFLNAGRGILELKHPVVLEGCASEWGSSKWTPSFMRDAYGDVEVEVKLESVEKRQDGPPLCEGKCEYRMSTMKDFCEWAEPSDAIRGGEKSAPHALTGFPSGEWFGYIDYKYFPQLFDDGDAAFASVRWQDLGINADPKESVFWMGTPGAATPLHYDSYGSNVVLQVYGKKEWLLFPPESSEWLEPSRIPFEESSIWSQVGVSGATEFETDPNRKDKDVFRAMLKEGDILFVPHHWWHQVQCISTAISINLWTRHANDNLERLREGLSRMLVMSTHWYRASEEASEEALTFGADRTRSTVIRRRCPWLNPNETMWDWSDVLKSINEAVDEIGEEKASNVAESNTSAGRAVSNGDIDSVRLVRAISHPRVVSVISDVLLQNSRRGGD